MSEPKFTGVWIPAGVFQAPNISITAKVVYGVVDALDNEDGCFASNSYLACHLGLGERQLRNLLKELEDAGLIIRSERDGRRIIRTVEKVALENALADSQTTRSGGGNKLPRGRKEIATPRGNKLPTYNKEDNKEDKDTGTASPTLVIPEDIPWTVALPFPSPEFSAAWQSWIDYRKEIKKAIKQSTMTAQWNEFEVWGEDKAIASIKQSIKNGWQGLFEPTK